MSIIRNPANNSNADASSSDPKQAGVWDKVKKASSDISAKTVVASKNTKETISIQKKQIMIKDRKKAFGIEYLDLLEKGNSDERLQACLQSAFEDIALLKSKVAKYEGRISANKEMLERKLSGNKNDIIQPSYTMDPLESTNSTNYDDEPATEGLPSNTVHSRKEAIASTRSASTDSVSSNHPYDEEVSTSSHERTTQELGTEMIEDEVVLEPKPIDQSRQHPTPSAPMELEEEYELSVVLPVPYDEKDLPENVAIIY